jgi:hypothetical protein
MTQSRGDWHRYFLGTYLWPMRRRRYPFSEPSWYCLRESLDLI